jgi:hypothetical protein
MYLVGRTDQNRFDQVRLRRFHCATQGNVTARMTNRDGNRRQRASQID